MPRMADLITHYSVPRRSLLKQRQRISRPIRVVGDDYPKRSHALASDWYYYVFEKPLRSDPNLATRCAQRNSGRSLNCAGSGMRWLDRVDQPQVFYTYEWALAVQRAYRKTLASAGHSCL